MNSAPRDKDGNPLTIAIIEELKAKGLNQSQIAARFGVTRQAVSWHRRTYNGVLTPREQLLEAHFPWKVSGRHLRTSPYRQLRDHGEWYATGRRRSCTESSVYIAGCGTATRYSNMTRSFLPSPDSASTEGSPCGYAVSRTGV
jgi:hypothetical protein